MKAKLVKESINLLKAKPKDEVLNNLKKSKKTMNQILIKSANRGFKQGVKYALDNGADVSSWNDYALRLASGGGYYDIVKLLLDNGANVHASNGQAINWARYNEYTDVVELLKSYMNK